MTQANTSAIVKNSAIIHTRAYVAAKKAGRVYNSLILGDAETMNTNEAETARAILEGIDDIAPLLPLYFSGANKYKLRGVSLSVTNQLRKANLNERYDLTHVDRKGGYNHYDKPIAHLYVQAVRKQLLDRADVECYTFTEFFQKFDITPEMQDIVLDMCGEIGSPIPDLLRQSVSGTLGLIFNPEKVKAYLVYMTL